MSNYRIESPLACSSQLRLFGTNSSNYINITSSSTLANADFTLPSTNGTSGQYLQRNGASSTTWVNGNSASTGDTIPITLRMIAANIPAGPTVISSLTFTVCSYFTFGGTSTSRTPTVLGAIFSITPANTIASIRLSDETNAVTNVTILTCTSTTTGITYASTPITIGLLSASQALMSVSAAITTATSISIYSIMLT